MRPKKEHYQVIVDDQIELTCRLDPDLKIISANNSFCQYFERTQKELTNQHFFSFAPEESQQKIKHHLSLLNPEYPVKTIQYPVIKSSFETCWLQWVTQATFNHEGDIESYRAIGRDITEQVLAEKALKMERDNFINILNSMQDGVYIVNKNYEIEFVNHALKKEFGSIENRKCYEYFHDKSKVCKWCKNNEVFSEKTVRWEWFSKKSGKTYDLIDSPLKNIDGSISKLEIFRDISLLKKAEKTLLKAKNDMEVLVKDRTNTLEIINARLKIEIDERKKTEKLLIKSKNMLQMVFDGISEPLIMLDPDLTVQMINDAAKKYYNVTDKDDFHNQRCFEFFKGITKPCYECNILSAIGIMECTSFDRKGFMNPDRTEQVAIYPLEDESDKDAGIIIRISDITEAKIIEKRLVQSEKLASLGLLISGIAHEINNPNNFIILNIQTLKKYLAALMSLMEKHQTCLPDFTIQNMDFEEFQEELFSLIDDISYGSERIDSSISRLKEYVRTRKESIKKWVDIGKTIEKSVSICESQIKEKVDSLEMNIPDGLPKIFTDPQAIEQIIINLLMNATQATDKEKSRIKLDIQMDAPRSEFIKISVNDNGCGMDEETKKKIFDPFFTTKMAESGTGLGLYISYNMVENLNGYFNVESEPGKGSIFEFFLPIEKT